MQFSTFALSALSIGSALAATSSHPVTTSSNHPATTSAAAGASSTGSVTVHVVKVGAANGTLAYFPNNIVAAKGDMVQFQFAPANHTVTQSTFDQPCEPLALHTNMTGFYSGFMPVAAGSTTTPAGASTGGPGQVLRGELGPVHGSPWIAIAL
jgi:plastocyanin